MLEKTFGYSEWGINKSPWKTTLKLDRWTRQTASALRKWPNVYNNLRNVGWCWESSKNSGIDSGILAWRCSSSSTSQHLARWAWKFFQSRVDREDWQQNYTVEGISHNWGWGLMQWWTDKISCVWAGRARGSAGLRLRSWLQWACAWLRLCACWVDPKSPS